MQLSVCSVKSQRIQNQREKIDGNHLVQIVHCRLLAIACGQVKVLTALTVVLILDGLQCFLSTERRQERADRVLIRVVARWLPIVDQTQLGHATGNQNGGHGGHLMDRMGGDHLYWLLLNAVRQCLVQDHHHDYHGDRVDHGHHEHALVQSFDLLERVPIEVHVLQVSVRVVPRQAGK